MTRRTKLRIVKMTHSTGYFQLATHKEPVCAACFRVIKGSYNYVEKRESAPPPSQDDWTACGKCLMRIHKDCGYACCPLCYD